MFIALPLVGLLFVAFFLITQHHNEPKTNTVKNQHNAFVRESSVLGIEEKHLSETALHVVEKKMKEDQMKKSREESIVLKEPERVLQDVNHRVKSLLEHTVLLIICSNRPEYLERTLKHVVKYHPKGSVSVLVSEDGRNSAVSEVIRKAKEQLEPQLEASVTFEHVHHEEEHNIRFENGYFKLAAHFKWALNHVFSDNSDRIVKRVIILEEDLQIAPDFFEYFASVVELVDWDPTVLAASAWNDNGQTSLVKDDKQLYRSDFFPGLGWMMTKKMWEELGLKWPRAYWDDWLREPKNRLDRVTIRPEVCRTFHFGAHGVSNSQYSEYLNSIRLAETFVPFTTLDLQYLQTPESWDRYYLDEVAKAEVVTESTFKTKVNSAADGTALRIVYDAFDGYAPQSLPRIAKLVGCMDNVKAGVPRTAYKGVVSVWYQQRVKVHLVPLSFGH